MDEASARRSGVPIGKEHVLGYDRVRYRIPRKRARFIKDFIASQGQSRVGFPEIASSGLREGKMRITNPFAFRSFPYNSPKRMEKQLRDNFLSLAPPNEENLHKVLVTIDFRIEDQPRHRPCLR